MPTALQAGPYQPEPEPGYRAAVAATRRKKGMMAVGTFFYLTPDIRPVTIYNQRNRARHNPDNRRRGRPLTFHEQWPG